MDSQNTQPQQISTQLPTTNKLLLTLGGIVLLLAVGVGSYFLGKKSSSPVSNSPSPAVTVNNISTSPTTIQKNTVAQGATNWKEYTDTRVGYSLKYPNDSSWKPFINNAESTAAFMCEGDCSNYTVDLFQITPVIFTSIDEYLEKDTLVTDKTKIQLSGQTAIKGVQSGSEQAGGSFVVVFFVHNGKGYLIIQRFRGMYNKTMLNQLPVGNPDIISTFMLTDSNNKYSNQEYNFMFNLSENERVVACPNKNENTDSIGVWVTDRPLPPTSSAGETMNECATGGPIVYVSAIKKSIDLNSIDDYIRLIEIDYKITKNPVTVSGISAIRMTGARSSSEPAPIPENIDQTTFTSGGIIYIIHSSFLERNFKLLQ